MISTATAKALLKMGKTIDSSNEEENFLEY